MTAAETPTAERLREQLAEFEVKAAEAEREIGAAALDGTDTRAATKRATDARNGIAWCKAALAEFERREAAAEEERRRGAASDGRRESYRWMVDYLGRLEEYLLRRGEFQAAEARLFELGPNGKIHHAQYIALDIEGSDLDTELLAAVPTFPTGAERRGQQEKWRRPLFRDLTPERASELRAFAEQREAQEAAGEGVDFSGVKTAYAQQRDAERTERRERREREKREKREAATR